MNDTDELDRIWRDGLSRLALPTRPIPEPVRPGAGIVGGRHRARPRAYIAIAAAAAVLVICGLIVVAVRESSPAVVETRTPATPVVVDIVDAPNGSLALRIPGRAVSGQPPHIDLAAGLVQFRIDSRRAGHQLVLDGVSDFAPTPNEIGITIRTVRLHHGVYRLYCAIPGHAEAGEQILLDVG